MNFHYLISLKRNGNSPHSSAQFWRRVSIHQVHFWWTYCNLVDNYPKISLYLIVLTVSVASAVFATGGIYYELQRQGVCLTEAHAVRLTVTLLVCMHACKYTYESRFRHFRRSPGSTGTSFGTSSSLLCDMLPDN